MCRKCDEKKEENLRVKNIGAKNICAKHLKTKTADINIADINSAVINNADINTLDVQKFLINGKDLTCSLTQPAVAQITNSFVPFGTTGASGPANVNPTVYNCLLQSAVQNGNDLQDRIAQGRLFINNYLASFHCPSSCPPAPTGPTGCTGPEGSTGCPVPLEIYGTLTLPIYTRRFCGSTGVSGTTGTTGINPFDTLNTSVNFNLQVAYLLEEAQSIDARVVSVLVQVGYVDPLGITGGCTGVSENVVIDEIFIANKQFYPTLDVTYGENFANTIAIDFGIIGTAYANSSNSTSQGAIQMVIYKEKGLCIWTPQGDSFECLEGGTQITDPQAGHQQQIGPICPSGQQQCQYIVGGNIFCAPCNSRCNDNSGARPIGPCIN